jgi:GTP-binding protein LepA
VRLIPPPSGEPDASLRALIIDSHYDQYRGVIPLFRVVDGELEAGTEVRMMTTKKEFKVDEVGVFAPAQKPVEKLTAGSVGYLTAQIREIADTRVGDTITLAGKKAADKPLPGYREVISMVYCGLYPIDSKDYEDLREALGKLTLNDAALVYEPETSVALGFGFRIGFLGLLHMEIIQERLEREFNLDLIATAPSVIYDVYLKTGEMVKIQNPYELPSTGDIERIEEPMVNATIICPEEFVGAVMELCQQRRGEYETMEYPSDGRCNIKYRIPLGEIITDFFDQLKSRSRGYASLDYELKGKQTSDLVRLDVLVNKEKVDALSTICHRDKAFYVGRVLVQKLKEVIPRQQFEVPIQAALGTKVIARETVKALRKNVLAKCYGGDISRKRKLLEKQKKGKERLKRVGSVEIPQEAFLAVLKVGSE